MNIIIKTNMDDDGDDDDDDDKYDNDDNDNDYYGKQPISLLHIECINVYNFKNLWNQKNKNK